MHAAYNHQVNTSRIALVEPITLKVLYRDSNVDPTLTNVGFAAVPSHITDCYSVDTEEYTKFLISAQKLLATHLEQLMQQRAMLLQQSLDIKLRQKITHYADYSVWNDSDDISVQNKFSLNSPDQPVFSELYQKLLEINTKIFTTSMRAVSVKLLTKSIVFHNGNPSNETNINVTFVDCAGNELMLPAFRIGGAEVLLQAQYRNPPAQLPFGLPVTPPTPYPNPGVLTNQFLSAAGNVFAARPTNGSGNI